MTAATVDYAYYSRCLDCHAVIAATVDSPEGKRHVGREIAKWVKRGETVRRAPIERVKAMRWCECYKKGRSKR